MTRRSYTREFKAEITSLRREVRKLKAERDILKKAAAYFVSASL